MALLRVRDLGVSFDAAAGTVHAAGTVAP